jgi:hypothetical protein
LERPVAVAEQDAETGTVGIWGREVELAVLVEVGDGDVLRVRADRVADSRVEGAVGVAEQDCDLVGGITRGDEVEVPVRVEVGDDEPHRAPRSVVVDGGLRRPVAVAEEDADAAGVQRPAPEVRHGHVELAVLVEVADGNPLGVQVGVVFEGGDERPVAVAERDGDTAAHRIPHRHVELAVRVKVSDGDCVRVDPHVTDQRQREGLGPRRSGCHGQSHKQQTKLQGNTDGASANIFGSCGG